MARTPELATEHVTAGDGYSITFRRRDDQLVGGETWAAQGRDRAGNLLVTFAVQTSAGTGAQAGKTIIDLHLTGAQTADLPRVVRCDLQESVAGGEPLTLGRWLLMVEAQVTQ